MSRFITQKEKDQAERVRSYRQSLKEQGLLTYQLYPEWHAQRMRQYRIRRQLDEV